MRVVTGADRARALLLKGRGIGLDQAAPEVIARTNEALEENFSSPSEAVAWILRRVREEGDEAVRELTRRLDGAAPPTMDVPPSAIADAYDAVPSEVLDALRLAAERIREFHETARPTGWMDRERGYGVAVTPVGSVGVYVPGGTAAYPSTVLMAVIPAKAAGVERVSVCTPAGPGGLPAAAVLAAADIAGADRVYRIGGAQAIGAMAYGTETVRRQDMVCGPGNLFVTLAKRMVFGEVGIDGLYGPTETLIVADETANPTLCAADLLAQAEHDALASAVLITTSPDLAEAVRSEVEVRLRRLDRESVARAAVEGRGCIAVVESVDEALALAAEYAPEHLSLMVREPSAHVEAVRNAGAVFLGEFSHEVLGDYVAGPSHVMPTAGTARFNSGLGVHSFVKFSPIVALGDDVPAELTRAAAAIARAEGLTAHAEAAEIREELVAREG